MLLNLLSNIYLFILFLFLFFLSFVITLQIVQLAFLQSNYYKLKKLSFISMSDKQRLILVEVLIKKKLWLIALKVLESNYVVGETNNYSYFNTLGFVYYCMNRYDLAEKYYLQAINIKDDYIVALQNLAKLYEVQSNYNLVVKTCKKILSNDSNNTFASIALKKFSNRDSRI